tara:strand:- start:2958 stop:4115 length:1158 start_codon:yes stop_codon:yes gene_type:complete
MDSYKYLFSLSLFKIAIGATLLGSGWQALDLDQGEPFSLAVIAFLAFVPASFGGVLSRFASSEPKVIRIFLILISLCFLLVNYFEIYKIRSAFYAFYFLSWVFIFTVDISFEKIFLALGTTLSLNQIKKLSSVSMFLIQISVVFGTFIVSYFFKEKIFSTYHIISFLFFVSSISPLPKIRDMYFDAVTVKSHKISDKKINFAFMLSFGFIWPCMAVFHMGASYVSKIVLKQPDFGKFIELSFGFAIAISGLIFMSQKKSVLDIFGLRFLVLLSFFLVFYISKVASTPLLSMLCIFIIGLIYGALRVETRSLLSLKIPAIYSKKIISNANMISGPLTGLFVYFFYLEIKMNTGTGISSIYTVPLVISLSILIFLFSINKINKGRIS